MAFGLTWVGLKVGLLAACSCELMRERRGRAEGTDSVSIDRKASGLGVRGPRGAEACLLNGRNRGL